MVLKWFFLLAVGLAGIESESRLLVRLETECTNRTVCTIESDAGEYFNANELKQFPILKILFDVNPTSTLMQKFQFNLRAIVQVSVRKVFVNDEIHYISRKRLFSVRKSVVYPKLGPIYSRASKPIDRFQNCLEEHCKKRSRNLTILKCHSRKYFNLKVEESRIVTKRCLNRINYIDLRGSIIENDLRSLPVLTFKHVSVIDIRNAFSSKYVNTLNYFVQTTNASILKMSDHMVDFGTIVSLLKQMPHWFVEIETENFFIWPFSNKHFEVYNRFHNCFESFEIRNAKKPIGNRRYCSQPTQAALYENHYGCYFVFGFIASLLIIVFIAYFLL